MRTASTPNGWFPRALLTSLILITCVNAMRPMVSYRALALGAGPVEIGLIAAAFGILSLLVVVPAGPWIDRLGEPVFIISGVVIMGAAALLLGLSDNLVQIGLLMMALGVGQILSAVSLQTLVANGGTDEGRDARFGTYTVSASVGQLIGPAAAGLLVAQAMRSAPVLDGSVPLHATDGVFVAAAAGTVIAFLAALTLWRWPPRQHARRDHAAQSDFQGSTKAALSRVLRVPAMPQAMLASLTVLSTVDILVAYLPAYGVAHGIRIEAVGILLGVRGGASVASRILMLPLRRALGRRRLLIGSMLVPAIIIAAIPFLGSELLPLLIAMALIGFGLGIGQPLTMSWVATRAPVEIRGTALGLRLSANRLGQFALPATVGLVAGAAGLSLIFWCLGGMLLISAGLITRAAFDAPASLATVAPVDSLSPV